MATSDYREQLVALGDHLRNVEGDLTRSWGGQHASFEHCDEWCKLWMLLAGGWYSLNWAAYSVDGRIPLKDALPKAHAFARDFLTSQPANLSAGEMNPWFTGYFLVSAEHRIANTIDRVTSLFFYPLSATERIYNRCVSLFLGCPHCAKAAPTYLPHSHGILAEFAAHPSMASVSMEAWKAGSPLARVYDRVNSIKHKKPDADAVSDLPIATRWQDAVSGIHDVALLMQDMTKHWVLDNPGNKWVDPQLCLQAV